MVSKRIAYLLKALYFFYIVLIGFYCFKRPFYNWDMLPYTALILQLDQYDTKEAHAITYKLAQENIPPANYHQLTDSSHEYRNRMLNDPRAFNSQLPFYVIKPLYIGIAYLFYKLGVSLPQATLVPSFISYLLIGILLFHWLGVYLRFAITFAVSLLIMISSLLIDIAKTSSPDCLSALLLLGSFYFIIEKSSLWIAFILMAVSVFARLDNFLTGFLILCAIYLSRKRGIKTSLKNFLSITALLIFCYLLVGFIAKQYSWSIFFYNDFADRLHPVYGTGEHFSFRSYLRLMYEHILSGIKHSYLALFMALLFLNFNRVFYLKELTFELIFSLLIPLIIFIRFILYPEISDRFYIAFYLVIIILLAKKINTAGITSLANGNKQMQD